MSENFSGVVSSQERQEALRLMRLAVAERLVLAVIALVSVVGGLIVPWLLGGTLQWLILAVGVCILGGYITRHRMRRNRLADASAHSIRGILEGESTFLIDPGTSERVERDSILECLLGDSAAVIWTRDRPFLIGESLFSENAGWQQFRSYMGAICARKKRHRNLQLLGSLFFWVAVFVIAWALFQP